MQTPTTPIDPSDFDTLVAQADAAPIDGWDFSWLDGRATEQRPTWGYQRQMAARLARARAALDLDTGGGEVLDGAATLPPITIATESWPPNLARAAARLHPRGVMVVQIAEDGPLPFADARFDLVTARHPVANDWPEITRVLEPGGTYFSQQVGPASVFELVEHFLGPQPEHVRSGRDPERTCAEATAAGLEVTDLRLEHLPTVFHDIGAVVYFLRKVIWMVPGFTVEQYRDRLRDLHEQIQTDGPFHATATRFLIEARKPTRHH